MHAVITPHACAFESFQIFYAFFLPQYHNHPEGPTRILAWCRNIDSAVMLYQQLFFCFLSKFQRFLFAEYPNLLIADTLKFSAVQGILAAKFHPDEYF